MWYTYTNGAMDMKVDRFMATSLLEVDFWSEDADRSGRTVSGPLSVATKIEVNRG